MEVRNPKTMGKQLPLYSKKKPTGSLLATKRIEKFFAIDNAVRMTLAFETKARAALLRASASASPRPVADSPAPAPRFTPSRATTQSGIFLFYRWRQTHNRTAERY